MPVSKRTRYEVLKRDNHTCRYCGASAPGARLTVDHVLPVTLGGTDNPDNLVAACVDCNAGKASTHPGAEALEDVRAADMKWAGAIRRVASQRARQRKKVDAYLGAFNAEWSGWHYGTYAEAVPRPAGWEASLERFYECGLPIEDVLRLARVALGNERVRADETFRYFAGCCWREITRIQDAAKAILDAEAIDDGS